jgi:hypothetical protein
MNKKQIYKNIVNCCNNLGTAPLMGVALEDADPKFLDIRESSLDEHVAVQPAAIAFFGTLKKDAIRALDRLKRNYEKWKMEKYAEAKKNIQQSGRVTIADIEAKLVSDNREDVDEWEEKLEEAQENVDTLEVYYDAWKQKAFSLNEYANLATDELFSKESIDKKIKLNEKSSKIKGIIKKAQKKE